MACSTSRTAASSATEEKIQKSMVNQKRKKLKLSDPARKWWLHWEELDTNTETRKLMFMFGNNKSEHLSLPNVRFRKEEFALFCDSLANEVMPGVFNFKLKSLSLQRCRIDEKKATVLGAALTKNTTLHSLDLEGNPLGPEGVNTIMRSLRKQLQTIARELIPSPRPDSDAEEEEIEGADSYLGEEETVKIRSTEPTYSGRDKKSSGRRRSSSGGQRSRSPSSVHSGHSSTSGSDTRYSSRRSSRSGRKSKRTSRTNMSSARKSVASRMGTPQGGRRKSHTETLAERKAVKKARDELDFEAPLRVLNLAGTEIAQPLSLDSIQSQSNACSLSNRGIKSIAVYLMQNNCALEKLYLGKNRINEDTLEPLIRAMGKSTTLQCVDFIGCKLNADVVIRLMEIATRNLPSGFPGGAFYADNYPNDHRPYLRMKAFQGKMEDIQDKIGRTGRPGTSETEDISRTFTALEKRRGTSQSVRTREGGYSVTTAQSLRPDSASSIQSVNTTVAGGKKKHKHDGRSPVNMIELNLQDAIMGDKAAHRLHDFLCHASNLRHLGLSNVGISATGLRSLMRAMRTGTLHSLDISKNSLGVDGAFIVAATLRGSWIALRKLNLSRCHLTDDGLNPAGALELAKALRENMSLHELDLSYNCLIPQRLSFIQHQNDIIHELAYSVECNVSLLTLDLRGNWIGPAGQKALTKALMRSPTAYRFSSEVLPALTQWINSMFERRNGTFGQLIEAEMTLEHLMRSKTKRLEIDRPQYADPYWMSLSNVFPNSREDFHISLAKESKPIKQSTDEYISRLRQELLPPKAQLEDQFEPVASPDGRRLRRRDIVEKEKKIAQAAGIDAIPVREGEFPSLEPDSKVEYTSEGYYELSGEQNRHGVSAPENYQSSLEYERPNIRTKLKTPDLPPYKYPRHSRYAQSVSVGSFEELDRERRQPGVPASAKRATVVTPSERVDFVTSAAKSIYPKGDAGYLASLSEQHKKILRKAQATLSEENKNKSSAHSSQLLPRAPPSRLETSRSGTRAETSYSNYHPEKAFKSAIPDGPVSLIEALQIASCGQGFSEDDSYVNTKSLYVRPQSMLAHSHSGIPYSKPPEFIPLLRVDQLQSNSEEAVNFPDVQKGSPVSVASSTWSTGGLLRDDNKATLRVAEGEETEKQTAEGEFRKIRSERTSSDVEGSMRYAGTDDIVEEAMLSDGVDNRASREYERKAGRPGSVGEYLSRTIATAKSQIPRQFAKVHWPNPLSIVRQELDSRPPFHPPASYLYLRPRVMKLVFEFLGEQRSVLFEDLREQSTRKLLKGATILGKYDVSRLYSNDSDERPKTAIQQIISSRPSTGNSLMSSPPFTE